MISFLLLLTTVSACSNLCIPERDAYATGKVPLCWQWSGKELCGNASLCNNIFSATLWNGSIEMTVSGVMVDYKFNPVLLLDSDAYKYVDPDSWSYFYFIGGVSGWSGNPNAVQSFHLLIQSGLGASNNALDQGLYAYGSDTTLNDIIVSLRFC